MSELLSVALVCAASLLAKDCSRDTALDVIVSPAHTPMECLMHAQATAAAAGLPGGDNRYLKITCERRRADAEDGRRASLVWRVIVASAGSQPRRG